MNVRRIAAGLGLVLAAALLTAPTTAVSASPASGTSVNAASGPATVAGSAGIKTDKPRVQQRKPASQRWHPQDLKAHFNYPYGNDTQRFEIQNYLVKAIRNTPKTGTIRISVYSFDRNEVADALIAAHKRGVHVQILMNDHQTTRAQRQLFRALGRNPNRRNFAYECQNSCRASRDNLHSKFYLFTRTGGVDDVVMLGSVNFTLNATKHQWNDLLTMTNNEKLHSDLHQVFDDMREDYATDQPYRTYCIGNRNGCGPLVSTQFLRVFPRKATPSNDAALAILNPIQCVYRTGGVQKRTVVRMSMHTMRGPRGDYLAEAFRRLWAEGCNVQVIYGLMGASTKGTIGASTARGRIPLRSAGFDTDADGFVNQYTHQKYVLINGKYGDQVTKMTFTGSSNWSSRGTSGDEIIFSVKGPRAYNQYMGNFGFMWNSDRNTRNSYTTSAITYRAADGSIQQRATTPEIVTNEPDRIAFGGKHWEDD